MSRSYNPELLNAILDALPPNMKITQIYYLPSISVSDYSDQVPVLLPKSKAAEIIRWISSEVASKDNPANKVLHVDLKTDQHPLLEPASNRKTPLADTQPVLTKEKPTRNRFTVPDSLDL